jgi:hypothetical protein
MGKPACPQYLLSVELFKIDFKLIAVFYKPVYKRVGG